MLTAWEKATRATVALPDFRSVAEREELRERTRQGHLICRTCQEPLWLHSGAIRTPHFAHRSLKNCPSSRVSEEVLAARDFLYWFFKPRIESGKLQGEIALEPLISQLPEEMTVDLLLRRAGKPPVAIVLCDKGLRPDMRAGYKARLDMLEFIFRPAFVKSRLKREEGSLDCFLLDVTQRAFKEPSPYDLCSQEFAGSRGTLHFVDTEERKWITLRGLALVHRPQVYRASKVRISPEKALLWSEAHAEWVHKGEAEALKAFLKPPAPKPAPKPAAPAPPAPPSTAPKLENRSFHDPLGAPESDEGGSSTIHHPSEPPPVPEPDPIPAWVRGALVCVTCGKSTTDWQNARPLSNECVCRECFARGARLAR